MDMETVVGTYTDFNSLAPCGANPGRRRGRIVRIGFQLTRPVWGEPRCPTLHKSLFLISTHSPRVGRTSVSIANGKYGIYFNSLAPCGANLVPRFFVVVLGGHFNSLAPCGANLQIFGQCRHIHDFNSLAPCGANLTIDDRLFTYIGISTHSPRVGRTRRGSSTLSHQRTFQLTRPVWGEPLWYFPC